MFIEDLSEIVENTKISNYFKEDIEDFIQVYSKTTTDDYTYDMWFESWYEDFKILVDLSKKEKGFFHVLTQSLLAFQQVEEKKLVDWYISEIQFFARKDSRKIKTSSEIMPDLLRLLERFHNKFQK